MKAKVIMAWLIAAALFAAGVALVVFWTYSQRYVQDSATTATTGIFFKTTLNLEQYKNVSSGNNLLGKYDRYSRSDRHDDVLTIYCREYCK